jgi:ETC complex I subunit conserved region
MRFGYFRSQVRILLPRPMSIRPSSRERRNLRKAKTPDPHVRTTSGIETRVLMTITARIYCPSRTTTQSGVGRAKFWILEFEPVAPRQIDPLMGWTSSRDMRSQVRLEFTTKEEAVAYAEKNGLRYRIEEPNPVSRKILSYSDNFKSTRLDQWTH